MSIADGCGRSGPRSAVEEGDVEVPGQSLGQVHRAHQVAEPHGVAVEEQAWSCHRSSVVRRRAQTRAVARTPSRSLIVARSSRLIARAARSTRGGRGVPEQVVARRRVGRTPRAGPRRRPRRCRRRSRPSGGGARAWPACRRARRRRPDTRLVEVHEADAAVVDQHVLGVEVAVQQDAGPGAGAVSSSTPTSASASGDRSGRAAHTRWPAAATWSGPAG